MAINLFADIETIPTQTEEGKAIILDGIEKAKDKIKAPGNYKKPESIAAYIEAERALLDASFDERYRKTALNGTYGEIVCIGWAVGNDEPKSLIRRLGGSEKDLLAEFFAQIRGDEMWVGHNIRGFDLRFLWQRAVINGVRAEIPVNARPSDWHVYDTMTEWAGWGQRISMDNLCRALGLPPKDGIDGSMVWDLVQAGEYDNVRDYCIGDVQRVRSIYKRMNFEKGQTND